MTQIGTHLFQPTSPVRETTYQRIRHGLLDAISTHVPRAGDDRRFRRQGRGQAISTHVPRAGDDVHPIPLVVVNVTFQPTSPVRETTRPLHGLRKRDMDFNPRPPCGRRHNSGADGVVRKGFQPTSPVRETTALEDVMVPKAPLFQPTSPVRETTLVLTPVTSLMRDFNPRPPCGRRRRQGADGSGLNRISTHVPRAGDDQLRHLLQHTVD